MKTLLVITPQTSLSSAIGAVLNPSLYRIILKSELREEELLLSPFSIDLCILDAELTTIEPIRLIERVRRCLPNCPMLLFSSVSQWEWEEEAYLLGVTHVLRKPVRGRLFNTLLDRILSGPAPAPQRTPLRFPPSLPPQNECTPVSRQTLELLSNCSSILTHSLCAESLLKEFLLLLREIIGINRAAIFLRQAPGTLCESPSLERSRRLRSAYAFGLPPGLLEHFELSLETGIGGLLFRSGRIVRQHGHEADCDPQIQKEFELLSAQVAIPILDRESFVGLAMFDGRLTGEPLSNEELSLLFHLLEQLGMAIKNIWLHEQIAANHDMLGGVLSELSSACVVIASDLNILHANETARQCFPLEGRRPELFEFNNLPQPIASKVFEVIKSGKSIPPFKYHLGAKPGKVFQITITPFQKKNTGQPNAALLLGEDFSHMERIGQLETEAANLRVVQQMAKRLAHEIGNALVPISTFQQLMSEPIKDPEIEKSLASAMKAGTNRVSRLVTQMRFLANDKAETNERISIKQLIEEAFHEAQAQHPASSDRLNFETSNETLSLAGNRVGLHHAFSEILLNALQANPGSQSQVRVRANSDTDVDGNSWAHIEIQDTGEGFTPEAATKGQLPFFTTRNVGLGLGLAVTHKIIETHHGRIEIPQPRSGQHGLIRVSLPLSPAQNGKSFPHAGKEN